jgi:hypothetical protein
LSGTILQGYQTEPSDQDLRRQKRKCRKITDIHNIDNLFVASAHCQDDSKEETCIFQFRGENKDLHVF